MRPHRFSVLFVLALSSMALMRQGHGQEWTRFRGPNGTGVSDCQMIPTQWTDTDYNWRVRLPGIGHSSPVVWGEKVFLLSADPDNATKYVLCYSAQDGGQLWKRQYNAPTHKKHLRSSYASSTPAVDAEHVYVARATPERLTLQALDHAGSEVWSRDLGPWVGTHGFGTSPILYEDMVILHNSQQAQELDPGDSPGQSSMLAFDRRTGKDVWKTPLTTVRVCYSVPFILGREDADPELICTSTGHGVFSLNPRTGKKNWSVDAFSMRVVSSPIATGGLIFGSNGSGGYSGNYVAAVRPGDAPELAYTLKNSGTFKAPYVPCMIPKGEYVFLIYDRGFAACLHAPSGEVQWLERTNAAFNGSPIRVRDRIYCIDEEGTVWVIAADTKQYRVLAKNPLGEPSRATPAVSGGRLYLRTFSQLFSVGGKDTVAAGS